MVSSNIDTLKSGANPPLQISFIKFDVAITPGKRQQVIDDPRLI